MSTAVLEKPVERVALDVTAPRVPEIRIYGHSTIFYWWPVWVAGFVMAAITYSEGSRAAIVPTGSVYDEASHAIVLPVGTVRPADTGTEVGELSAESKNLGVVFTIILLAVVFITNTPLRGLWSGIAVLMMLTMTVTFAWLGWWQDILDVFGRISIHMDMGFYVFFSSLLFLLWISVVFGFDRMRYWKFQSGQLTHESVFGGGHKSYDTSGMLFEKLRDDPFRHWLLGAGSGDLLINTAGAQREQIQIPNVLMLDRILVRLQKMVSERPA